MKTILLANHDESVRIAQKKLLSKSGYIIVGEAVNVGQTLEKFKKLMPDLVIVGFDPIEFDGIQAIKEMQTINSEVKLIVSSNFCAHPAVVTAIQLGVKDWVFATLPLHSEQLIEAVQRILIIKTE